MKTPIYFTLILLCFSSCMNAVLDDDYGYVDPEIRPYLDEFLEEGRIRGHEFNIATVKMNFGDPGHAAARTYYQYEEIIIDKDSEQWRENPTALVFHELGHLLLHREHDNSKMDDKWYKSIMQEKARPRFDSPLTYRRKFYMDELFNPETPFPDWAYKSYYEDPE